MIKRNNAHHYSLLVVLIATVLVCGLTNAAGRNISRGPSDRTETLCHIPPGNPDNAHTIVVSQWAVAAHLGHGDTMGECPEECVGPPAPVAKTGQTDCWGQNGRPRECSGTDQDGAHQKGVPSPDPRFSDNGNGTVTDNLTGLVWLQDPFCMGQELWWYALAASNNLADGTCGLTDGSEAGDWRLPNINELRSLIDHGTSNPALTEGHPFSGVRVGRYWSSTSDSGNPVLAWWVGLRTGTTNSLSKSDPNAVWPVRGGQ